MKMTKLLMLCAGIILLHQSPLFAEYVFLKDGSILNCKIENESASTVILRLGDGTQKNVSPKNIMRILFTDLYMGKIFVNKTDGTILEVYMVDEDQTTYTFRKDLYKPEEFKLRRDEVLFTARKNPTGLVGISDIDSIKLEWKPPFNKTKFYKVYFKSAGEYKVHGQTGSTSYTIKGLKGNTLYSIKVTAIDPDNYESLPSNEIKVITMNIAPDAPEKVKCVRSVEAKGKMTAKLNWKAVNDPDGKIKTYRIYQKDEKGFTLSATTTKTGYEIKNLDSNKNYYYTVRAVDDKDAESGNSHMVNTLDLKGYDLIVAPVAIIPFGRFGVMNKLGYGVNFTGLATGTFFDQLNTGITLGFWYLHGANEDINRSMIIPFMGGLNYWFEPYEQLRITPRISAGYAFNYVNFKGKPGTFTGTGPEKIQKSKWTFEPIVTGGITFSYGITDYWTLGVGCDYGIIYEMGGLIKFMTLTLDITKKF
jgi:hypothetical protein